MLLQSPSPVALEREFAIIIIVSWLGQTNLFWIHWIIIQFHFIIDILPFLFIQVML